MAPISRPSFSLYMTHAPAIASAPHVHASDGSLRFSRLRATLVQSSPIRVDLYPLPRLLVEAAERNEGCATFRRGQRSALLCNRREGNGPFSRTRAAVPDEKFTSAGRPRVRSNAVCVCRELGRESVDARRKTKRMRF